MDVSAKSQTFWVGEELYICTHKTHGEGVVIVLGLSGKLRFAFAGQSMLMQLSLHPAHLSELRCACLPDFCELSMA